MLNTFAVSGILIVIACSLMAIVMLVRASSKLHYIWGIFCLTVLLWGIGAYRIGIATDQANAVYWWKFAYIGVIFIPIMFAHFVYVFLNRRINLVILPLYALGVFYLYSNLFGNNFINSAHLMFGKIYFLTPTPLYNSFFALFLFLVIYSHIILFKEYKIAQGLRKQQIQYFFVGSFLGFFGGSFSFLPEYQINIYPFMNLTVSFYPIIMGIAILRYKLMNINIITTQLLIASLWVFISVRALISEFGSNEQLINILLLFITVIVGILLYKSVLREIESREEIERLARDLERTNIELKRLDEAKSEFISIASHQLRTPLSIIKGYISMIREGSYGKVSPEIGTTMNKVYLSNERLIKLVNDLLDLSRMESGRMKYEFAEMDLRALVDSIVDEFQLPAKDKGIRILWIPSRVGSLPKIFGDAWKLRQVIFNLIDNSLKYTNAGDIEIKLEKEDDSLKLSVKDSGIGMSRETAVSVFHKFVRGGKDASRANAGGTGLGLYIAKRIVDDHKGEIWAESKGEGKGSTFFVTLPITNHYEYTNKFNENKHN